MRVTRANPKLKEFAERLLAFETDAHQPLVEDATATFLVCEKLRRYLSVLAGSAGFHALLCRALTLAQEEVPALRPVHVKTDGSLEGLREFAAQAGTGQSVKGEVVLVAQFLGLLVNFIGEALTLQLVQDVWPQATVDGLTFEKRNT